VPSWLAVQTRTGSVWLFSRPFRSGGRVGGEQLFHVYSVGERLAKRAVDMGDGGR